MGLMLAEPGYHTRCFVEWEEYPRETLVSAQRAGYFAPAPIWDDVTNFDARPFAGAFDTLIAGYPCQPFSQAGQRKGEDDERHLWPHIARIIDELGDGLRWCFFENVSGHLSLGFETVLGDLRRLGFTPAAGLFSAEEVGATHERQRVFIVAYRKVSVGRGELEPGRTRSGRAGSARVGAELANADGRDARPERQQRVGKQRFQPEGDGALDDAGCAQRRAQPETGDITDRTEARRHEGSGGFRKSSNDVGNTGCQRRQQIAGSLHGDEKPNEGRIAQDSHQSTGAKQALDHAPSSRCDGEGERSETGTEGGQRLLSDGCEQVEHATGERCGEGRAQPGSPEKRHAPSAPGPTPELCGPLLFPPGPGDREAWTAALAIDPSRAPAFARRDAKTAALNLATILPADAAKALGQLPRDVEVADILRALGREAPEMVDNSTALTVFRDLANGLAPRTRALKLLGNGVVPLCAAYAWRTLSTAHGLRPVDLGTEGGAEDRTTDDGVLT